MLFLRTEQKKVVGEIESANKETLKSEYSR